MCGEASSALCSLCCRHCPHGAVSSCQHAFTDHFLLPMPSKYSLQVSVLHQAKPWVHCLQGLSQTGGCLAFTYQLLCPALRSGLRRQDTNTETRPPSCCINTSMMRVAYDSLWSAGKTSLSTEQSVCSLVCMPEVCLTVCSGKGPSMLHCPDCLLCTRIFPSDIVQHASECSNTEAAHIRPVLRQ